MTSGCKTIVGALADRFDLPPADGAAPPVEDVTSTQAPATTGPDNAREPR